MSNKRKQAADFEGKLLYGTKRPEEANIGEIFMNRTTGKLSYKKNVGVIIDIETGVEYPITGTNISYDNSVSGLAATNMQTAIDELAASGGGSAPTTTVVNISSAQILAMGSSPIELLPAPGAGKYYDIEKIILEYTHVTTAYTGVVQLYISQNDGTNEQERGIYNFIDNNYDLRVNINDFQYNYGNFQNTWIYPLKPNTKLELLSYSGDPTDGDGTIRAIITYTVRTFGA